MPLVSKLHVVITADGVTREFSSEGDGWVVVAAFRSWLTSPDCQLPMAVGADDVDVVDEPEPSDPQPAQTQKRISESRTSLPDRLMHEAFFAGSDKYDLARLMSCTSTKNHTVVDVKNALIRLVHTRRIGTRTVGSKQEWWRIPPGSSTALEAPKS